MWRHRLCVCLAGFLPRLAKRRLGKRRKKHITRPTRAHAKRDTRVRRYASIRRHAFFCGVSGKVAATLSPKQTRIEMCLAKETRSYLSKKKSQHRKGASREAAPRGLSKGVSQTSRLLSRTELYETRTRAARVSRERQRRVGGGEREREREREKFFLTVL